MGAWQTRDDTEMTEIQWEQLAASMDESSVFDPTIPPIDEDESKLRAIWSHGRRNNRIINSMNKSASIHMKHRSAPRNGVGWFENLEEEKVPHRETPEVLPEPVSFGFDNEGKMHVYNSPPPMDTPKLADPDHPSLQVKRIADFNQVGQ